MDVQQCAGVCHDTGPLTFGTLNSLSCVRIDGFVEHPILPAESHQLAEKGANSKLLLGNCLKANCKSK